MRIEWRTVWVSEGSGKQGWCHTVGLLWGWITFLYIVMLSIEIQDSNRSVRFVLTLQGWTWDNFDIEFELMGYFFEPNLNHGKIKLVWVSGELELTKFKLIVFLVFMTWLVCVYALIRWEHLRCQSLLGLKGVWAALHKNISSDFLLNLALKISPFGTEKLNVFDKILPW